MAVVPHASARTAWRPPDELTQPVELVPTSSSYSQGLRLGLYTTVTYETLCLLELFGCQCASLEYCETASLDFRALYHVALGALGGLTFVHPLYKDSTAGRSAVANSFGLFGGLGVLCISRGLAELLQQYLTQ